MKNDAGLAFVLGIAIGAIVMTLAVTAITSNRYKQGQIDALTGHVAFCLDDKYQWVDGKPGEGLRCREKNGQ